MSNLPGSRRRSGIGAVGDVAWGTHLCQLFSDKIDLLEILAPYFRAGLEQNEKCVWTVFEPLTAAEARDGMAAAYPGVARRISTGDLEITGHEADAASGPDDLLRNWGARLVSALQDGYTGLRMNVDPTALASGDAERATAYEEAFGRFLDDREALVRCCYPSSEGPAQEANAAGLRHRQVLANRPAGREPAEPPALIESRAEVKRLTEELSLRATERTRELMDSSMELTREVTSRQKAERALRESEERFRFHFGLRLVGQALVELSPKRIEVNDRLCEMLGYARAEMEKAEWATLTHPDDLEADLRDFGRMRAGTENHFLRAKRWIGKNGCVVHTNTSVKCQRNQDGSIHYLAAIIEEVTWPGEIAARDQESGSPAVSGEPHLSERELEVARWIGLGHSVKEIAAMLQLSEKTVSTYRIRILSKLKLHTTAELIRYTLNHKLSR